jgi:predicted nucleic acid-binding protein
VGVAASALADTSWFIARERRHLLRPHPGQLAVSIVTVGELRLGVLATPDPDVRAVRVSTLLYAESLPTLPVDRTVAEAWAHLLQRLRAAGRELPVRDSWIAATAIAHELPLVACGPAYSDVPGLHVIRV